jgi:hypothetical protein
MTSYIKISIGIFIALAASRFIPHPPNFTSLLALSFYIPAILGVRFIPALVVSFIITDLVIGFHSVALFTWGSIVLIGLFSNFSLLSVKSRISGSLIAALLFFVITNFGVWSLGSYGYSINGLITCYTLAIPFFGNTLVSTLIFSILIELILAYRPVINKIFN